MTNVMRSPVVPTRSEARLRLLSQRLQVLRAEIDIILAELAAEQLRADYGFDSIAAPASEAATSPADAVAPSGDTVRHDAPPPAVQQATVAVNDAPHEHIVPRPAADTIDDGERAATAPATRAAGHATGAGTAAPAQPTATATPVDTAASATDIGAAPIGRGDDTPSPSDGSQAAAATATTRLMFGQSGVGQNGAGRHLPTIEAQFDELPGFTKIKPPPIPTAMLRPIGAAGLRDAEIIDLAVGRPARQPAADVAAARTPRLRWRLVTTIAACILILLAFIVAMLADGRLLGVIGADATARLKPAKPAIEAGGDRATSVPTPGEPGQGGDDGLHELSSDDTGAASASTPR